MAKSFTGTLAVTFALAAATAGCDKRPQAPQACARWAMKMNDIALEHPDAIKFTVTAIKTHEPPKSGGQLGTHYWTESKARVTASSVQFTRQELSDNGSEGPVVVITPGHLQRPTDAAILDRLKKCGFTPVAAPAPEKS